MKNIPVFFVIAMLLALQSCYKDKGNYDYQEINTISFDMSDSLYIQQSGTLAVSPNLVFSMDEEPENLSFKWELSYSDGTDSVTEVISTERNLNEVISFDAGNSYPFRLTVKDEDTGIEYIKKMSLFVISNYQPGYFLLEQKNGGGDISFVNSQSGDIYRDIFSAANPSYSLPATLRQLAVIDLNSFSISANDYTKITYPSSNKSAVLFEGGGYVLDYRDMKVISNYATLFDAAPSVIDPTGFKLNITPNIYTINNGQLHRMMQSKGQLLFGDAFDTPDENGVYLAPYEGNHAANSGQAFQVFFDTKNKRFVYTEFLDTKLSTYSGGYYATIESKIKSSEFAVMGSINVGRAVITYAVLRDYNANKAYMPYFVGNYLSMMFEFTDDNLMAADVFEWATDRQQMYYAVDNRLYMFTAGNYSSRLVYTFPEGEDITSIRLFRTSSSSSVYNLVVGTYGASGKLYHTTIASDGAPVAGVEPTVYEGFGKIVDIAYKGL